MGQGRTAPSGDRAPARRSRPATPALPPPSSSGPIPADTGAALATAVRRTQRLVDDPDGAVWYGARRIFAYALMIRGGIPTDELDGYLLDRAWLTDAARLLSRDAADLAAEMVEGMLRSGAVNSRDGRIHAAADHAPADPSSLAAVPFPRDWPASPEPAPDGTA